MSAPQKGLVSFIRLKLSTGIEPEDIKHTLLRAGFSEPHIDHAFRYVREMYSDALQQIVESNDYLPSLSKDGHAGTRIKARPVVPVSSPVYQNTATPKVQPIEIAHKNSEQEKLEQQVASHALTQAHSHFEKVGELAESVKDSLRHEAEKHFKVHKGLFKGRLRRKDFTLGFIFFFAVGYVTLALSAVVISIAAPEFWGAILSLIQQDTNGVLLMTVPVILAPITVMMLSLITRRLHNLGLPGSLSWLYLTMFIPVDIHVFRGMWFIYIALLILFVLLLAKKGEPVPNQYGPFPGSKGSFFRRIFNV